MGASKKPVMSASAVTEEQPPIPVGASDAIPWGGPLLQVIEAVRGAKVTIDGASGIPREYVAGHQT